jgi:hypothetical protein
MNAFTLQLPAGQEEAFWQTWQQAILVGDAIGAVITGCVAYLKLSNKMGKFNWGFLQKSDLGKHLICLAVARQLQLLLILLARPVYYRHRVAISIALKAYVSLYLGPEMLRVGLQQARPERTIKWLGINGQLQSYASLCRALLLPTGVYLSIFEVFEYYKMPFRAWLPLQLLWALRVVPATWPLVVRLVGFFDSLVQEADALCAAVADGISVLAGFSTPAFQSCGSGERHASLTLLVLATQLVGAGAAPRSPAPRCGRPPPLPSRAPSGDSSGGTLTCSTALCRRRWASWCCPPPSCTRWRGRPSAPGWRGTGSPTVRRACRSHFT